MNNKKWYFIFTVLTFFILSSSSVLSVQDIYEYENKDGVTEFTDKVNKNKNLQKHIQIKPTTEAQKARGEAQLNKIMENDKQLDKELAEEKLLEEEKSQQRKDAMIEKSSQQGSDDKDRDDGGYYYPTPRHLINRHNPNYPVNKPNRPIVKPSQPINQPNRPIRPVRPISR